jgi:hypothetical protein
MNIIDINTHWVYFLEIERDFINLKSYISVNEDNYKCFSFELSKILQLSCSEIDSTCRLLCNNIDPENDYLDQNKFSGNTDQYSKIILNKYPKIIDTEILVPDLLSKIKPLKDWKQSNSPSWWKAYNKVKHYRHNCYREANLENAIYALTSLMVLIQYLFRAVNNIKYSHPNPLPKYFDNDYLSPSLICNPDKELPDFE